MQEAMRFIQDNFKQVSVLKERNGGMTEIVIDAENAIYIRKTIPYIGLPYRKLMKLSHPLLPKIYYAAEGEGHTCVIEQYVDGRNLQDILDREGALPEETVRRVGLQLCDALEFLHGQGIIHRDIKPSNIILKEDGTLCLIDFGAARVIKEDAEQDTRILGTPGFAPPEQYGFAATDYRSDFYAAEAIRCCVELDPERRVASARELRTLLQSHWYDFLTQPGKRNAAVGLVALLLVGGVAFWSTQQPPEQKLPESGAVTQGISNETGVAAKDKNVQADSGEVEKTQAEGNTKTGTGAGSGNIKKDGALEQAAPSENPASGNATKKAPPIVSSNKGGVSAKADNVQFSGSNWNVFQKTEQHLGPKVANADKVVYPPGQWPRITIQNRSDTPLKNPQAVLHFTDFGVVGNDLSVTDYNNTVISSKFADKGGNGVARTVTLRYDGTVPPHETYHLNLFGGIAGLFKTGANPSVRVVFSADNAENQEKFYMIIVR